MQGPPFSHSRTALLEHLLQNLARLGSEPVVIISNVGAGKIFLEVLALPFHADVIGPLLVVRILSDGRGDDSYRLIGSGRPMVAETELET